MAEPRFQANRLLSEVQYMQFSGDKLMLRHQQTHIWSYHDHISQIGAHLARVEIMLFRH